MGLIKLFSDGKYEPPNPDPKNFKILAVSVAKNKRSICVVEVNYPGCTTFEGNKILVYEAELSVFSHPSGFITSYLDPHFTDTNHLNARLIARFPANDQGLQDALDYAEMKSKQ
jgi:hypothetical protein